MYLNRFLALLVSLIFILSVDGLFAQDSNKFAENAKQIRIKKIATEWQGSILTLHTYDDQETTGRLIKVSNGYFHLETSRGEHEIPLKDVVMISFKPGLPELLLSIASAAMGGAFVSGALLISNEDASSQDLGVAALLGLIGGGLWGYSTFYETEVFNLE